MRRARVTEQGQSSALAAIVVAAVLAMAVGFAAVGTIVVERQGATVAADSAALASAIAGTDPTVAEWYRDRGIDVRAGAGRSDAAIGQGEARSRATASGELTVSPAVVAIVARAGQLLGLTFEPLDLDGTSVTFDDHQGHDFAAVASGLRMCEVVIAGSEGRRFVLC